MAVIRNTTSDALALFRPDAPTVQPDGELNLADEHFAGRAWPKSTWKLVKKPGKGFTDASSEDAYLYLPADAAEPATPDSTEGAAADIEEKS